jgi:hypothetical protein
VLKHAATLTRLLGTGDNTLGNAIERDMGYELYNRHPQKNDLKFPYITTAILQQLGRLSRYCDAVPYPLSPAGWRNLGCRRAKRW